MYAHLPNQEKVVAYNIIYYINVACISLLFSYILSIPNIYTLAEDLLTLSRSEQRTLGEIFYTKNYIHMYVYSKSVSPGRAI